MEEQRKSIWHHLVIILFGSIATTGVGAFLSYYVSDLQKTSQVRTERAMARAKSGVELEQRILGQTGNLMELLRKARIAATKKPFSANDAGATLSTLDRAWQDWRRDVYFTRNNAARLFDVETANLIYLPSNKNLAVDNCAILAERDDTAYGQNCADRLKKELVGLSTVIDTANKDESVFDRQWDAKLPIDFYTSFTTAKVLLKRLANCRTTEKIELEAPNLEDACKDLKNVTQMRINTTGVVQEEIAARLFRVWASNGEM